jgi:nondiscriminating aspartyl-tRNA synthetase
MKTEQYGIVREIREFKWGGFIILETFNGQYQCVLKGLDLSKLKNECYVHIFGEFVDATIKKELVVSTQEISVESFDILSSPSETPGINIYTKEIQADTHLIFDQRALTLRNETNKCVFKAQSVIHNAFRTSCEELGAISISTPKIVAHGAEGGTNVFSLDYFGKIAYLAQSPQLYKQMMCGALGKVYETAPVFRAEKHASSRHLNEYMSLDFETILYKDFSELMQIEKRILFNIFYELDKKLKSELKYIGVDSADFFSNNPFDALTLKVSEIKTILGSSGSDLTSEEEREIARYAKEKHNTDFVFSTHYNRDARPFYTKISPDGITTESFDLIYKGVEITSGGQRKESMAEYENALREAGMSQEPFEGYLTAFRYGMPLHGGFAIGLERLTAKICNVESVKAATLFPRDVERLTP